MAPPSFFSPSLSLQDRKNFSDYDPRYTAALQMVSSGVFGRPEYFEDLVASITDMNRGNDWFLLGKWQRGYPCVGLC